MRKTPLKLACVLAVATISVGCGRDGNVDVEVGSATDPAAEAGSCPDGVEFDLQDPAALMSGLQFAPVRAEAAATEGDDGTVRLRDDALDVRVAAATWERFESLDGRRRAWVGKIRPGLTALLIASANESEPFVVGDCMAETYTPFLREALRGAGATDATSSLELLDEATRRDDSRLVRWIRDEATSRGDAAADAALPWSQVDPRRRTINPQEAPPAVRATLLRAGLIVDRPKEWASLEATTICSFVVDLGWGDCYPLTGVSADALVGASVEFVPGTPLEIWVMDDVASFAHPGRLLATLDAAATTELASPGSAIMLRLTGGDPTTAEVVTAAGHGLNGGSG